MHIYIYIYSRENRAEWRGPRSCCRPSARCRQRNDNDNDYNDDSNHDIRIQFNKLITNSSHVLIVIIVVIIIAITKARREFI